MIEMYVLGVDIGGVIIDKDANDDSDTSLFGPNFLNATAVTGAFESLTQLATSFKTYLISKCGPNVEQRTREWLAHNNFYATTGIPEGHLRFCGKRNEKAAICAELGVTHFVDDRLEVLSYLPPNIKKYLFRSNPEEVQKFEKFLKQVTKVESWEALLHALRTNL